MAPDAHRGAQKGERAVLRSGNFLVVGKNKNKSLEIIARQAGTCMVLPTNAPEGAGQLCTDERHENAVHQDMTNMHVK